MHPDLVKLARELNIVTEYKTIRVATGEIVKVEDSISPTHQRILEAAYKAGQKSKASCAECGCKASEGWALYCLKCSDEQREWVGLTDIEINNCIALELTTTARNIEAKLKVKNHVS
jgi:hypothetical protein